MELNTNHHNRGERRRSLPKGQKMNRIQITSKFDKLTDQQKDALNQIANCLSSNDGMFDLTLNTRVRQVDLSKDSIIVQHTVQLNFKKEISTTGQLNISGFRNKEEDQLFNPHD